MTSCLHVLIAYCQLQLLLVNRLPSATFGTNLSKQHGLLHCFSFIVLRGRLCWDVVMKLSTFQPYSAAATTNNMMLQLCEYQVTSHTDPD